MARPQKDTVEYFPHDADAMNGDTLTVLQGRWGNDGYAFWFKLLEQLASTEGHFIDCSNPKKWQLILGRTRVDHSTGLEMMKLLVEMGAIDKNLWEKGIIWCQNLVNNVAQVYQNRRRPLPLPPVVMPLLQVTTLGNSFSTGSNLITTDGNTQSKVKESKLEETRGKETTYPPNPPVSGISLSKEDLLEIYKENIGFINEDVENELELAMKRFTAAWVCDAIKEACLQNRRTWRYAAGILLNWERYGRREHEAKDIK
jgi:DnaD/phage-associated family protein